MLKPLYCCPDYMVSDEGYVINKAGTGKLKPSINHHGYEIIVIMKDKKPKALAVHTAVIASFKPNDKTAEKWQVNHIDGNKRNNHISNLEWVSPLENSRHKIEVLHHQAYGGDCHNARCIYGINVKTNDVLEFKAIIEAAKYIGSKLNKTKYRMIQQIIWRALNGLRKTAYGFKWFYQDVLV